MGASLTLQSTPGVLEFTADARSFAAPGPRVYGTRRERARGVPAGAATRDARSGWAASVAALLSNRPAAATFAAGAAH